MHSNDDQLCFIVKKYLEIKLFLEMIKSLHFTMRKSVVNSRNYAIYVDLINLASGQRSDEEYTKVTAKKRRE